MCILMLLSRSVCTANENDEDLINQVLLAIESSVIWDLDSNGFSDSTDPFDRFGETLSHGDYNGDGRQDLAIGIPGWDFVLFGTTPNVGTVLIMYGTPYGLSTTDSQFLFQTFETDPLNFENTEGAEANDFFGKSLASGDFNCDGISDLAVGTPTEGVTFIGSGGLRTNVGAINVFYGSMTGFSDNGQGSTFIHQASGGNSSVAAFDAALSTGDGFGWSMTVGNFNGDSDGGHSCLDLAVSAPFEDLGNENQISDGGIVHIYYGDVNGISASDSDVLSQNALFADGSSEINDQFGYSLAAGRFRGIFNSGFSDLAIGIPMEDVGGITNAGAVHVFNGGVGGLQSHLISANDDFIWSQSGAISGTVEADDRFGMSLLTGDFNADQADDLVVGVPRENIGEINNAGAINVIYGGVAGLTTNGNQLFSQNTVGILNFAENSDQFGLTLTSNGDLNYDSIPDLVVGVPGEDASSGAFHIIYGGASGLSNIDNEYIVNPSNVNIGDEMSFAMTVADFGKGPELVVSMPGDNSTDDDDDSGSVQIFTFENLDVIFKNSFEFN